MIVLTRAISLRRPRIFFRLSVCPILSWNFSLKSWSARSCSWWRSSTSVKLRIFSDFMFSIPASHSVFLVHSFALHEAGAQRQLVRCQTHSFRGLGRSDAFHLE